MGRHGSSMGGLLTNFFNIMAMQNATFSLTSMIHAVPFTARATYLEHSFTFKPCPPELALKKGSHGCLKFESGSLGSQSLGFLEL